MTSTTRLKGSAPQRRTSQQHKPRSADATGTAAGSGQASGHASGASAEKWDMVDSGNANGKLNPSFSKAGSSLQDSDDEPTGTPIQRCVHNELRRYFTMLDGEEPSNLYRMVIRQAEIALLESVMHECRGNQTRAALWLGISRGNLRSKLADMEKT